MCVSTSHNSGTLSYYEKHAREYSESTVKLDLHELHDVFLKELPRGAHILDAGCGTGRDTKTFLKRGYLVTAIDGSPEMAKLATDFTGQHCETLCFQQMKFYEEFDGIWACASILHVPKREMPDIIERFIRALRVGGVFYISLKEGEGERTADDGRFFNYYTEDSFRKLLASFPALREIAFWKTAEIRSQHHAGPWLNFLLRKVRK